MSTVSAGAWKRYVDQMSAIDATVGRKMADYIAKHGLENPKALVDYGFALATKYGEASGALAAEMYDLVMRRARRAGVAAAVPAPTATYHEAAQAIYGALNRSSNAGFIASAVQRLTKQAGEDTMLNNAMRDGSEFAWVPAGGETCAFCLMLASNGWQKASYYTVHYSGHADHIHANCECHYMVRNSSDGGVRGYNPDYYKRIYDNAEGTRWQDKVNSIRRDIYAENADEINEQKRIAYAERQEAEE